jgi:N utilization substance protein B
MANTTIRDLKTQFYTDNVTRHLVDWTFFNKIIEGTIRNKEILDEKIALYAVNKIDSINLTDLVILRLGAYELYDCLDIPYQVILNEYVEQTKLLGTSNGHGFVNSLLNRISEDFRSSEKVEPIR